MLPSILREIDSGTGERELGEGAMAGILCPVRCLYGDRSVRTSERPNVRTSERSKRLWTGRNSDEMRALLCDIGHSWKQFVCSAPP